MNRLYAWTVPTAVLSAVALIVSLNTAAGTGTGATSVTDVARSGPIAVELGDLYVKPAKLEASGGAPVTLKVHNAGGVQHNLKLDGGAGTPMLDAGGDATLELGVLPSGTYRLFCEVAGHAEAGMEATLEVGEAVAGTSQTEHAMTAEEMDASYTAGVKAFPATTKGVGGVRLEPRIDDGVKVFELTASEVDWEVAPGDIRKAMAYNGIVPGPEIRTKLGDRVRIVFRNRLSESSAIHFHGLDVPNEMDGVPGLTQDLVKPGGEFTYGFTVPNAGSYMYHSHMNGAVQIPKGLLGAFIVEGPDEPAADVEHTMILNDGPLGFTINGKGFPATAPVVAKPGQTVRIRYMNEGLQGHPMHLHGMPQTVFAKDGYALPQPYKADTIWVAPGERYDVLVTARPGRWAYHCHILSHAEKEDGMFGMVTAMIVK